MRKKTGQILSLLLLPALLAGCAAGSGDSGTLVSADETYETTGQSSSDYELTDNKSLYEEENNEVVTMYLTVGQGNEEDDTDHTWTEINSYPLSYYEEHSITPYKCEAVLQVGDEAGPVEGEFGYSDRTANATVQLRGEGASQQQQKSYRIKIKDGDGDYNGQKTISLNKHSGDPVRFKNKLAYSLIQEIPEMIGARTQLVHLYVKDKTEGEDGLFQDYGLYTQVEQINKTYLKNHGFDNDGALYQVGNFDWQRHEDVIMLATDANYDKDAFEQYLEVDGSEEHDTLIALLDAVNDTDNEISDVVEQYFDKDNLYYWMAFHILMGNKDVLDGNYYLYSPRGVDKWYFISWDNDGILKEGYEAMEDETYQRSWNKGIFTFSDTVLFERILKDPSCRQNLDSAVQDLYENYLTEENVQEKIDDLQKATEDYVYSLPDQTYARVNEENYNILVQSMAEEIRTNYEEYTSSMASAWPFHILEPVKQGDSTVLQWEESYQEGGGDITYSVELSRDYTFSDCMVSEQTGETRVDAGSLSPGQYFVRVRATGSNDVSQDAYEYYQTEAGSKAYSTLCFYVQQDGSISAVSYSED